MKFDFSDLLLYRLVVGELDTNCYLLSDKISGATIIIDPGDAADYIETQISRFNLNPQLIIATHGHFDHVRAALELQLAYQISFLMDKKDVFLLKNLSHHVNYFLGSAKQYLPPQVNGEIKVELKLGQASLKVLHVPGHTPGSICLYNKKNSFLLSGDTLFKNGIGRTDFSYSSQVEIKQSLKKLLILPDDTLVFPGHGAETTIGEERQNLESI